MGQLFRNNAYGALGASLSNIATTLTVASGQGDRFPAVSAPDFFMLTLQDASNNIEIVKVTSRTAGADAMTIQRAQEGTTARAWNIGDVAELRLTAQALNPLALLEGAGTAAAIRAILDVPTRTGGDASGTWAISISGNAATASSTTGNAGTATALQTARNINGVSFNGTANITVDPQVDSDESTNAVHYPVFVASSAGGFQRLKEDTGLSYNPSTNTLTVAQVAGNAASVTGGVYTTGDQTIAGTKTFSSAPVVPGINGGQLAGMRNKIINGKMEIAQRGTGFAAANGYNLDRWSLVNTTAAVVTIDQQSDFPGNEFRTYHRTVVTTADAAVAAGDTYANFQSIEGFNARDLIGRTFTLSFWVRSAKTGTHCIAFKNAGADRAYIAEYTVNAVNTWEQKSVTVSGGLITAGTWNWTNGVGLTVTFTLMNGTTRQTTANAWQTGDFYSTANQVNCLDTVDNIFAITGVQLEIGLAATPFEHRPYGAELALCEFYYRQINVNERFTAAAAGNISACTVTWPRMRATPTVGALLSSEAVLNAGSVGLQAVLVDGARFQITASAAGDSYALSHRYPLSAEL